MSSRKPTPSDNTTEQPRSTGGRKKTGFHTEILGGLSVLDLAEIKAADSLAYATGYITGKTGQAKDPMSGVVPMPDYDAGWDLGMAVYEGKEPRPAWDHESPKN
jgi:hypothetical protein